jgi:arabinofuranosyltransferase
MAVRVPRSLSLPVVTGGLLALAGATWRLAHEAVVFDDAFISYRYAQNLVAGQGLVYNPGERVEGFTNLLWTLLNAVPLWLGSDPLAFSRVLGALCLAAAVGAVLWASARCGPDHAGTAALLAPLLTWPFGMAAMATTGLETPLVGAVAAVLPLLYFGPGAQSRTRNLLASTVGLVGILARLDAGLLPGTALLVDVAHAWPERRAWRQQLGPLAARHLPWMAGTVLSAALRFGYYGDLLPNTYYAKAGDVAHWEVGGAYLLAFARNSPWAVLLLLALLASARAWWATPHRLLVVHALSAFGLFSLYAAKVGGDFMYYRFMFELLPALVVAAAAVLAALAPAHPRAARALAAASLALSFAPPHLEHRFAMQSMEEMDGYYRLGAAVAPRLNEVLPRETVLSTTLAGTLAYFSDRTVVDEWGLNDAFVAHLPRRDITYRGHVKRAPLSYLQERRVNLVLGHPVVCPCDRPCVENLPNVFIRLGGNRCLRSWYLTQDETLTRHLCSRPRDFLLWNVACPT